MRLLAWGRVTASGLKFFVFIRVHLRSSVDKQFYIPTGLAVASFPDSVSSVL